MNCKQCSREVSERRPYHFSNEIAQKLGYCWFGCILASLGKEKALKALQENRNKV